MASSLKLIIFIKKIQKDKNYSRHRKFTLKVIF